MNTKVLGVGATFAVLVGLGTGAVLAGEIKVGGTGAAAGVLQRLGETYQAAHQGSRVEVVPGLGSSGGIAAIAEGALDLSVSSRALKAEETGKDLEIKPFFDTPFLFVTSHSQAQKLTKSDVVAIFDGTLTKWSDGKEIKPVLRPKSEIATTFLISNFDGMGAAMDKLRQRSDVPVAATDQDNTAAAEKILNSFAGATLTQIVTEAPRLRPVALDGVEATVQNMLTGSYPLTMRIYLVTNAAPSSDVRSFITFLHSREAAAIARDSGAILVLEPESPRAAHVR